MTTTLANPRASSSSATSFRSAPNDFPALRERVAKAGLFAPRPDFFARMAALDTVLLTLVIAGIVLIDTFWFQMLNAVFMAFVGGQIGLLGHDAGHCQVFKKQKWNMALGQICGMVTIASRQYWVEKHNEHHAHPNHEDMDPDIDYIIMAFTPEQAVKSKGLVRWIVRHQTLLFLPIVSLAFLSLRMQSIRYFFKKPLSKTWVDFTCCTVALVAYLGLLFTALPPVTAICFIAVHQVLWGMYIGSVFAPNHKGMPTINNESELDFVREQVLTSRNVRAHAFTDFWYGGLNYQIEHHLFPNMPRSNLRGASKLVREFCAEKEIAYHETSLPQSYREILAHLRSVSQVVA